MCFPQHIGENKILQESPLKKSSRSLLRNNVTAAFWFPIQQHKTISASVKKDQSLSISISSFSSETEKVKKRLLSSLNNLFSGSCKMKKLQWLCLDFPSLTPLSPVEEVDRRYKVILRRVYCCRLHAFFHQSGKNWENELFRWQWCRHFHVLIKAICSDRRLAGKLCGQVRRCFLSCCINTWDQD